MPERLVPASGPHSGSEDRQDSRAIAGRRQTLAGEPGQPEANTGNKRGRRIGTRTDQEPGPGDRGSGPQDASTGSAKPSRGGIEWAGGAKRSPCTRKAADQERPRQRIDPGPTPRPGRARTRSQIAAEPQPGRATHSIRTKSGQEIAEGQPAAGRQANRPVRLLALKGQPSEQKRAVRRALAAKEHSHGPFMRKPARPGPAGFLGYH